MIEESVRQYIGRHGLLAPGVRVLVALSGGADSVALLDVLRLLGYDCVAAHCNFRLRGAESDRDEAFVRQLCAEWKVRLEVTAFDTAAYAQAGGLSVEMAARELRYRWFEQLRADCGAEAVAVAHHRDDSVETMLINLLRGTGIDGLGGIAPKRDRVVRPLLCVDRADILHHLASRGLRYVTDSTNLEDAFVRNKIRLHLLPLMETVNPAARANMARTADLLRRQAEAYHRGMRSEVERVWDGSRLSIEGVLAAADPSLLLYEVLAPLGFRPEQAEEVLRSASGQVGKEFRSERFRLVRDRTHWLLAPLDEGCREAVTLHEGDNRLPDGRVLRLTYRDAGADYRPERTKDVACLDAERLPTPLVARPVARGDWFIPFGMKGRRLLSDFLTDLKYSRLAKERAWVVCAADKVAWVVGERPDNRFRIDEGTRRVAELRIMAEPGE
ncbi:MAG: tRNA lysidine(34) synthetase TilS [Bacteroidaceae bacterium]